MSESYQAISLGGEHIALASTLEECERKVKEHQLLPEKNAIIKINHSRMVTTHLKIMMPLSEDERSKCFHQNNLIGDPSADQPTSGS